MSEVFNHTEQPTQRLLDRHDELVRLTELVDHTEPRRSQIEHEMTCLVFELTLRTLDEPMPSMELEVPMGLLTVLHDDDIEIID
jgi:hypothetical protein